jgi:hypothetical protein
MGMYFCLKVIGRITSLTGIQTLSVSDFNKKAKIVFTFCSYPLGVLGKKSNL